MLSIQGINSIQQQSTTTTETDSFGESDDKYIKTTENLCANFNCEKRSIARKEPHNKNASAFFPAFPSTTETTVRGVGDKLILKYKLQMNRMRDQRHKYHQYYDNSKMIPHKKYYYGDSKKYHKQIRFSRSIDARPTLTEASSTFPVQVKVSDTTPTANEIKSDTNKSDIRFNKFSESSSSSTTSSSYPSSNSLISSAMPIFTTPAVTSVIPFFTLTTTTSSPKKHYKVEPSVIIDGKSEEFDSGRRNDEDYPNDEPRALPLRPIIRGPNEEESDEEISIVYAEQHAEIKLMCEVDLDISGSIWSKNGQVFIEFN